MKSTNAHATGSDFASLAPWYGAEFLAAIANNLFIAGAVFYARNTLHRSNAECLWIMASWGFLYIFLSLLSGKLTDRLGAKKLVVGASFAGFIVSLIGLTAVAVPQLWVLIACMALFNMTSTPLWPALESAITRTTARASLSRRIAIYNVMWSSGAAVSTTASGVINSLDPRAIFILSALASLAAFALVYLFATAPVSGTHASEANTERGMAVHASSTRAQTLLHMAWLVNPLSFLGIFVLLALMPQLLQSAGNVSNAWGGLWSFVRVGSFILFSVWTAWHYRVRYMLIAYLLMSASFVFILRVPNMPTLVIGQCVFGITAAFLYCGSLYYAMHVSAGAGGHAGIHEAMIGAGMFVGPFIGAIAAATGGGIATVANSVTAVLGLGLVALLVLAKRAGRRKEETELSLATTGDTL